MSPASTSAAYHSRFLRNLIAKDRYIACQNEKERMDTLAQQASSSSSRGYIQQQQPGQSLPPTHEVYPAPPSNGYGGYSSYPSAQMQQQAPQYYPPNGSPRSAYPDGSRSTSYQDSSARMNGYHAHAESSARGAASNSGAYSPYGAPMPPQHQTESDAHYWKHMFAEIGYPESNEESPSQALPSLPPQHAQPPPQHQHSMGPAPGGHVLSPLEAQPPRYMQPGQQQQNGYGGYHHQHVEQGAPRSMAAYADHRM
jgi:hypothetical protein